MVSRFHTVWKILRLRETLRVAKSVYNIRLRANRYRVQTLYISGGARHYSYRVYNVIRRVPSPTSELETRTVILIKYN